MSPDSGRLSLMQRALGIFVLLAFALGLFLWAGRTFVQRRIESVHLDTQRLAALRTFERAIVPLNSLPNYSEPSAEMVREQFQSCAEPLKETHRQNVSLKDRRINPCANTNAPEELACYLRTINSKLFAMGGSGRLDRDRMLSQTYVVSVERWMDAIRIAQRQQTPGSPSQDRAEGRSGTVSCNDEIGAARQLAANDGRLLGQLAWRDLTVGKSASSGFAQDQVVKVAAHVLEQRNPWGGIPGCIFYGGADAGKLMFVSDKRQGNRLPCLAMRPEETGEKDLVAAIRKSTGSDLEAGDPAWTEPESLDVILADLDNIRLPWKDLYHAYTEEPRTPDEPKRAPGDDGIVLARPHGPNELELTKHKVDAGFNVHLTIQPDTQRIVQQVSQCYAGDANACRIIGVSDDKKFKEYTGQMYERAAVRMAAVAVIDVATGKIEALGSAHTDCYRQEYDGPGRNAGECPDLPTTPHYEPDRLLNHALYVDALPASTIKPIMAIGYLHDPAYRKKLVADRVNANFARFQDELKSSDSAAFLDRMFCKDTAWTNCRRPQLIQDAALAMGWDPGCIEPSFRCGRLDVLFGFPSISRVRKDSGRTPLGASVIYGRLLTEPADTKSPFDFQLTHDFSFDGALAAECSRGDHYFGSGQNPAWRKCRQGHFSKLEQEGWGQGNARATAVGAAGMIARLATAASGQDSEHLPYLVDRISDVKAQTFDLAARQFHLGEATKIDIPRDDAELILQGMISHKSRGVPSGTRTGTANGACVRVFDAATCNKIDWVAGKTGTPPYGNDDLTLAAIRKKCGAMTGAKLAPGEQQELQAACTRERPYKWYIAAFQTGDTGHGFNKAIAVLTERNWHKSGPLAGKVQSPGDHDEMNVSAEMAFRIMDRIRGAHATATQVVATQAAAK
jgi:hypothetical protein